MPPYVREYVTGMAIAGLLISGSEKGWLKPEPRLIEPESPPPPRAESYWEAYWAVRRGHPSPNR